MKRYRTLISVLLGLMLLVQGFAVSAAPRAMQADATHAEMTAKSEMPCHMKMGDSSGKQLPSCCNASCPDMTTCAFGHIAAVPVISLVLPETGREMSGFTSVRILTRTATSLLRPPITLHG